MTRDLQKLRLAFRGLSDEDDSSDSAGPEDGADDKENLAEDDLLAPREDGGDDPLLEREGEE